MAGSDRGRRQFGHRLPRGAQHGAVHLHALQHREPHLLKLNQTTITNFKEEILRKFEIFKTQITVLKYKLLS